MGELTVFPFHARTSNNSHTYYYPVPMTQARPFLAMFHHAHRMEPRKLRILFSINRKFFFLFFQTKDLRSTVTREACVTLRSEPAFAYDANHIFPSQVLCLILIYAICFLNSYLSTMLKSKFDHTAEAVLPTLINLIPNSAKVIPHCRIDKVTIQNWQWLRYRVGKLAIK